MKDLTYIKVKEGKLWASDQVKPHGPNYWGGVTMGDIENHDKDLEAFNQSFEEVGNPDVTWVYIFVKWNELIRKGDRSLSPEGGIFWGVDDVPILKDGLYPVSGLQFEVGETECCKLNPNGCDDCVNYKKVAILSLKQEQPSEEKEYNESITRLSERGYFNVDPNSIPKIKFDPTENVYNAWRNSRVLLREFWFRSLSGQSVSPIFLKTVGQFLDDTKMLPREEPKD